MLEPKKHFSDELQLEFLPRKNTTEFQSLSSKESSTSRFDDFIVK